MLIGDPSEFAIESSISIAYEELGARSLGYFVIHIGGRCYGVREPDATLMACSIDEVERRLTRRGSHTAPFATEPDAGKVADAFREAIYAPDQGDNQFFGISQQEFSDYFSCSNQDINWAPDGDEAFDDWSYVMHFDVEDRVRLIGFRSYNEGYHHNPATLSDVWLEADKFYTILQTWRDAFEAEWNAAPKLFKAHGSDERHDQHLAEIIRLAALSESLRQSRGGARN
jgi:hypothetical protein